MSISSLGSAIPLPSIPNAADTIGTKQVELHNSVGQYLLKDQIKLSEKAISLLGGTLPAGK